MQLPDLFNYNRRLSSDVRIGDLCLGSKYPVRVQSMANTDTNDVEASVAQCIRVVDAGCELMRYTAQGMREAESLRKIHAVLRERGYTIPLVADIHFNADVAELAAQYVEKVRINPGNFVGSIKKKGDNTDYTEAEFKQEYENLRQRFVSLLNICKQHKTAIRIGVNHGSLSERIMNRYGDTSQGMVESCMELLRICKKEDFHHVVISMKTSNTPFMVYTVRLLVKAMSEEGFAYPLHLGVTEAGDGEDGRIKSAAGIGALLVDGIGDTIRVSLSEDPELEIPVAKTLVSYIGQRKNHPFIRGAEHLAYNPFEYKRRKTHAIGNIGGENVPVVVASGSSEFKLKPDYFIQGNNILTNEAEKYLIYTKDDIDLLNKDTASTLFLKLRFTEVTPEILKLLYLKKNIVVLLETNHQNPVGELRAFFHLLLNAGVTAPVIILRRYSEDDLSALQIKAAADLGVMLIDGFGDGLLLENTNEAIDANAVNSIAFGILQATRVRISKTEYISCPGCGRTLFDLQQTISRVKEKTSHLKGLKIAIMGCIVNGPGEMADADYGYVGAGRGKVSLYKKKICVERNIPEDEAVDKLLEFIKKDENCSDN